VSSDVQSAMQTLMYAEVGRFLTNFAKVESQLHETIRALLGVSWEKSLALTKGKRYADLSRIVRDISSDLDENKKVVLVDALDQLDKTADLRNQIMHRGLEMTGLMEAETNNRFTAKNPPDYEFISYSLLDVTKASTDITFIMIHLHWAISDEASEIRRAPWVYTHPQKQKPMTESKMRNAARRRERGPPKD